MGVLTKGDGSFLLRIVVTEVHRSLGLPRSLSPRTRSYAGTPDPVSAFRDAPRTNLNIRVFTQSGHRSGRPPPAPGFWVHALEKCQKHSTENWKAFSARMVVHLFGTAKVAMISGTVLFHCIRLALWEGLAPPSLERSADGMARCVLRCIKPKIDRTRCSSENFGKGYQSLRRGRCDHEGSFSENSDC